MVSSTASTEAAAAHIGPVTTRVMVPPPDEFLPKCVDLPATKESPVVISTDDENGDNIVATRITTTTGEAADDTTCSSSQQHRSPLGLKLPSEKIEVKLFVGRLPTTATEDDVRPLFAEFGEVVEVAIIRDKHSGQHKGSCFVRMASITQADAAVRALNGIKALDPSLGPMQISYATGEPARLGFTAGSLIPGEDEAKLFVGSLPRDVTEEQVESFFSAHGKAFDCYLMREPLTRRFRGCCFVKFAMKEEALLAVKRLHGLVTFPGSSRPLEVRIAEPKRSNTAATTNTTANNSNSTSPSGGGGPPRPPTNTNRRSPPPNSSPTSPNSTTNVLPSPGATASSWPPPAAGTGFLPPQTAYFSNGNPRSAGAWKEFFTPEGRPYYHNEQYNITQWDPPLEFIHMWSPQILAANNAAAAAVAAAAAAASVVPPNNWDVVGPPGANIFIFHVPADWTEQDLVALFSRFGNILSAKVAVDHSTGRNRGFGFVSYDNVSSAIAAVQNMNLVSIDKKRLRVAIKSGEEKFAQKYAEEHGINFIPIPEHRSE